MKTFIDDNGIFEITIPFTWKYSLKNNKIHTFQEYEVWKPDAFQISILNSENEEEKLRFNRLTKNLEISRIGKYSCYCFPVTKRNDIKTNTWALQTNGKIICITLTHSPNDVEDKSESEKISIAIEAIKSFRLIPEKQSKEKLKSYRFSMFLQGVGATSMILNNAIKNKAFIEATCIIANQIDALLRTGIILKSQIDYKNNQIDLEWIYQGIIDKRKSEKDVYKKAETLGVISKEIRLNLYKLYEDRNRVVHRFIISEITIADIEDIAYKYYEILKAINKIIYDLESEQIRLKVGMTSLVESKDGKLNFLESIKGKIGKSNYFYKEKKKLPTGIYMLLRFFKKLIAKTLLQTLW